MIEPEVAFLELPGLLELAEQFVAYVVGRALDRCAEDLKFLERDTGRLETVTALPAPRLRPGGGGHPARPRPRRGCGRAGPPFVRGNDFGSLDETILTEGSTGR